MSSYHRVFSQRRWSAWALARMLITFLLDHVVPPGPMLLAGDDTVTERRGPHVFGKGRHRWSAVYLQLYRLPLRPQMGGRVSASHVALRYSALGAPVLGGLVPPPRVGSSAWKAS
jgi:hypothetical protein